MSKQQSHTNVLLNALRLVRQADASAFSLKLVYTLATSLLPLGNLYVLKLLVDGATQGALTGADFRLIIPLVIAFAAIYLLNRLFGTLAALNNDRLSQRLIDHISNLIQTQSASLDLAYYDNPDYHDTFHRAQQEANYRPLRILDDFTSFLSSVITIAGIVGMLCSASWLTLVVMVVAVLPTFVVRIVKSRRLYAFRRTTTPLYRRSGYLASLLTAPTYAKETRAYRLAPHFRSQFVAIRRNLVAQMLRIARRLALMDLVSACIEAAAVLAIVTFLLMRTYQGAITIGSFVMLFEAFRRGQSSLQSLASAIAGLYDSKLFIGNLFEFMELPAAIHSPKQPTPFPKQVERVQFCDITFRYPTTSEAQPPVLSHFSWQAQAGQISHLEGENGFGKTTLLKLLLRLYDPDEGQILINGIDLRSFDLDELRSHVCAIFQDHVRFFFTAKENITFGSIDQPVDEEQLRWAIQMSEAQPVIDRLSKGLDTPLGRQFDNGEELSMGQWQRIALARQLYSKAPILVFDEPTAWMDHSGRDRFMEHLNEICQDRIVILISHI